MKQGQTIAQDNIDRIARLLRTTVLDMQTIARRFGISSSAVGLINRRFNIRRYVDHFNFERDGVMHNTQNEAIA